jgi:hypothetical protein
MKDCRKRENFCNYFLLSLQVTNSENTEIDKYETEIDKYKTEIEIGIKQD